MATTKKKATGILMKRSTGDYIFDTINVIIMLLLCLVTLYPMYFVICASFTKNTYLVAHPGAVFYPVGFTVGSYKLAFSHPLLLSGYKNILIVLAVSLPINIALTLFCGYFLASKNVLLKKPVLFIIMFTMFFSGGMIPGWLNIRSLGLYNSLWALILPGAMSVYNSIICRTICACVVTSSALVGSSQMMTSGSTARERAMPMRWRWPPENSWGNRSACSAFSPTIWSRSPIRLS